jgi:hypothetical protein
VGPLPYRIGLNRNWNDSLIQLAWTAEIMRLAKLVSAYGRGTS